MNQVLLALLLSGLMGLLGQGIRAVVGLRSNAAQPAGAASQQSEFDAAYLGLSLMIGFIAGVLAGIGIGLDQVLAVDPTHVKTLLGIAAAGYAGADFIENAFTRLLPSIGAAPQQAAAGGAGPVAPASPPRTAAAAAATGGEIVGLADALRTAAPKVNATAWTPALSAAFTRYSMTSHREMAAALGQFLVEAGAALQDVRENLNYSTAERLHDVFPSAFPTVASAEPYVGKPQAIADRAYANRLGNGSEASGDGWTFRGRGLIQLTGRDTYARFAASIGKSIDEAASYCETPEGAAMSGCWFLSANGCIPLADSWELSEITRKVNAKMLGSAQRINYAEAMLKALGG
jgi:predicted chitinase